MPGHSWKHEMVSWESAHQWIPQALPPPTPPFQIWRLIFSMVYWKVYIFRLEKMLIQFTWQVHLSHTLHVFRRLFTFTVTVYAREWVVNLTISACRLNLNSISIPHKQKNLKNKVSFPWQSNKKVNIHQLNCSLQWEGMKNLQECNKQTGFVWLLPWLIAV